MKKISGLLCLTFLFVVVCNAKYKSDYVEILSDSEVRKVVEVDMNQTELYEKIRAWIDENYYTDLDKIIKEKPEEGYIEGYGHKRLPFKKQASLKGDFDVYYKYIFEIKDNKFRVTLTIAATGSTNTAFYTVPPVIVTDKEIYPGKRISTSATKAIIVFSYSLEKINFFEGIKGFIEGNVKEEEW